VCLCLCLYDDGNGWENSMINFKKWEVEQKNLRSNECKDNYLSKEEKSIEPVCVFLTTVLHKLRSIFSLNYF